MAEGRSWSYESRSIEQGAVAALLSPWDHESALAEDLDSMPIVSIETAWIRNEGDGNGDQAGLCAVCRVTTSDGVSGIGVTYGGHSATVCQIVDTVLRPLLFGEGGERIERLWSMMHEALLGPNVLRPHFWTHRAVLAAISIVDQALWEIRAVNRGQPLCRALGGECRSVRAYHTAPYISSDVDPRPIIGAIVERSRREGISAIKLSVGRGIRAGAVLLDAFRSIAPDMELMVDAHQSWDLTTAARAVAEIERFDLVWLEEPIKPHGSSYRRHNGYDAHGDLARLSEMTNIPLAVGKNHPGLAECTDAIARARISYMQFDGISFGGITEWLRVARFSAIHGVDLAPSGPSCLHAHLASSVPGGLWVEIPVNSQWCEISRRLLGHHPEIRDGAVVPGNGPGWGFRLDEDYLGSVGSLVNWLQ
jgi:L-alanine-DL-glutamate epimerase-like enolase superfamily enzyme